MSEFLVWTGIVFFGVLIIGIFVFLSWEFWNAVFPEEITPPLEHVLYDSEEDVIFTTSFTNLAAKYTQQDRYSYVGIV